MTKLWNAESKKLLAARSLASLGWSRAFGSWRPKFGTEVWNAKSQMLSVIGGAPPMAGSLKKI